MAIGPVDIEFIVKGDIDRQLQKVGRTVKGESAEMTQQMTRLKKESFSLDKQFSAIGQTVKTMLPIASFSAAALALKNLTTEAYNFSKDFSKAMREVETISTAVKANFEGISKEITNVAANGPDDAIRLAQAYYQIVSAGHDGAAGLELLKVSSKAAIAGVTDTKIAADGLTTVLNAWGKDASQATKVADVLFKTVEKGKTTFPELAQTIAQVAPMAAAMGIPLEEIAAAIASITKQGTPTAQAMTQIRGSLVGMNKVLGDGWSNSMTYQEGLEAISKKAGGSQNELKKLIPEIEGVNAVLALTGAKAKEASNDLSAMQTATGSMTDAYNRMMQEADNKWSVVHNKWQRELKKIGDLINQGSLNLADKLNELLTDRDADIVAPGVAEKIGAVSAELDALGDRESKLKLITGRMIEMRNETDKLRQQENRLKKQQPSSLQSGVEAFNAGIGLGAWATPGRTKEKELAIIQDDIKINEEVRKKLEELYRQVLTATVSGSATPDGGSGAAAVRKTTEEIQKEIEILQKDVLDAEGEQQKSIAERIVKLQEELAIRMQIADEALRATRNAYYGNDVVPAKITPKDNTLAETFKEAKKEVKSTGLEIDKINKKIEQNKKNVAKWQGEIDDDKFQKFLSVSDDILTSANQLTQQYYEQLGLTSENAKNLNEIFKAGSGIVDLFEGNYFEGAVKLIGSAISLFLEVPEAMNVRFEEIEENVTKVINSLEVARNVFSNLNNPDVTTALSVVKSQLNELASDAATLNKELGSASYGRRRPGSSAVIYGDLIRQVGTLDEQIDKLTQRLLKGNLSDAQRQSIEALLNSYNKLKNEIDSITQDLTGTTVQDLAEGLASAFLAGEDAAEAWGERVNDIIRNVMVKQLTAQLLTEPIQNAINQLISDTGDGLTTDEAARFRDTIADLSASVGPAFDAARQALESVGISLGDDAGKQSAMSGAVKSITEETAGLISGQMMGIRVDMKAIVSAIIAGNQDMTDSLAVMKTIEENTRHNARLKNIEENITETNRILKERL